MRASAFQMNSIGGSRVGYIPASKCYQRGHIVSPSDGVFYERVCGSANVSVHKHISETTRTNFTEFTVHAAYGHGLVFLWWPDNITCIFDIILQTASFFLQKRKVSKVNGV